MTNDLKRLLGVEVPRLTFFQVRTRAMHRKISGPYWTETHYKEFCETVGGEVEARKLLEILLSTR